MKNLFILLAFLLSSCGATYHLRQAQKHIDKAIEMGAKVNVDTVYKNVEVPVIKIDTVVNNVSAERLLHDTITVTQNNEVIKIKYQEKEKKVYVNLTSTKPRYIRVPYTVTKTISSGYTKWDIILAIGVFFIIGFIIGFIYRSAKQR